MASSDEQCCTIPPFKSDYVPIGKTISIQNIEGKELDVYITGPLEANIALVGIYGRPLLRDPHGD